MDATDKSDSLFLAKFDFPRTRYQVVDVTDFNPDARVPELHNMMGIHTRGSGYTPLNEYYQLPEADLPEIDDTDDEEFDEDDYYDLFVKDTPELIARQQVFVDSLILNESALEFVFEGTRYYDVMRYAMRQANPGQTMAEIIGGREGKSNRGSMAAIIAKLADQRNWYLSWKGKIGM